MIKLTDVQRIFQVGDQAVHALRDINLNIAAGEYLSIMGPSGSGKSTLLNLIGLLDRATDGTYELDNKKVTGLNDEALAKTRRNKIGFVFQSFHLVPRLTAAENVALPMTLAGIPAKQRRERVQSTLESLGIEDRADHKPDQLSGGQRQRVAISRAIIMEPEILLADEPTGNLDQASGAEVLEVIEALNCRGITLLVVTHDAAIGRRAGRRIRMVDGAVVADESEYEAV